MSDRPYPDGPLASRRADEPDVRVLTFDELVDRMREPLAGLEAVIGELAPATADFVRGMRAALDRYDADAGRATFTCPACGRTSYNPNDAREGYCGACHAFTRDRDELYLGLGEVDGGEDGPDEHDEDEWDDLMRGDA